MDKKVTIVVVVLLIIAIVGVGVYFYCKDKEEKTVTTNTTNTTENTNTNDIISESSTENVTADGNNITDEIDNITVTGDGIIKQKIIGTTDANKIKSILDKYVFDKDVSKNESDYELTLPDGTKYYILDDVNGVVTGGKQANLSEQDMDTIEDIIEQYEEYDD